MRQIFIPFKYAITLMDSKRVKMVKSLVLLGNSKNCFSNSEIFTLDYRYDKAKNNTYYLSISPECLTALRPISISQGRSQEFYAMPARTSLCLSQKCYHFIRMFGHYQEYATSQKFKPTICTNYIEE